MRRSPRRPEPAALAARDRATENRLRARTYLTLKEEPQRLRTEQPPYSILNRGIEAEVLPVEQLIPLAKQADRGRHPPGSATCPAQGEAVS